MQNLLFIFIIIYSLIQHKINPSQIYQYIILLYTIYLTKKLIKKGYDFMPYPLLHIFYTKNNFILNFLPLSASYQPKISIIFQFYFADKNKNQF